MALSAEGVGNRLTVQAESGAKDSPQPSGPGEKRAVAVEVNRESEARISSQIRNGDQLEFDIFNGSSSNLRANVTLEVKLSGGWIEIYSDIFEGILDTKSRLYDFPKGATVHASCGLRNAFSTLKATEGEVRLCVVIFEGKTIYSKPLKVSLHGRSQ